MTTHDLFIRKFAVGNFKNARLHSQKPTPLKFENKIISYAYSYSVHDYYKHLSLYLILSSSSVAYYYSSLPIKR